MLRAADERVTHDEFLRIVRKALAQGVKPSRLLSAAGTAIEAHFVDEADADSDDAAGNQPW